MQAAAGGLPVQTLRKCAELLPRGSRTGWYLLVLLGAAAGGLEAVGAVLLVAVLGVMTGTAESLPVVGSLPAVGADAFSGLVVAAAAFFVVRALVLLAQTYLQNRVANNAGVDLASRLFARYLETPYALHVRRESAELIRNAHESVDFVARYVLVPAMVLASEALIVAGMIAVLLVFDPVTALAAGAALGVVVLVVLKAVQPRLGRLGTQIQDDAKLSLQSLQEGLSGFRDATLLGRTQTFQGRFVARRRSLARSFYLQATMSVTPRIVIETAFVLLVLGLLAVLGGSGDTAEDLLPTLALFGYAVLRILPAVNRMVLALGNMRFGAAAVDNVHADLIASHPSMDREQMSEPVEPFPTRRSVDIEHVTFRYEGEQADALVDVSLRIPRGDSIGLVGPTGGGKTTLLDVLVGLLEPAAGRVMVDGVDIRLVLARWQRSVGVVSQDVFLLDDTLRANIAFGVPDDEVDDEAVARAVELAALTDFAASLPDGLQTRAGERGVRLSGGQKQRVAIARALYRDPALLVFDEGTSALDTATEAAVLAAVNRLRGDRTIVTVAHRLSTVRDCDLIAVVEQGRIVATGTFEELSQQREEFGRLAR